MDDPRQDDRTHDTVELYGTEALDHCRRLITDARTRDRTPGHRPAHPPAPPTPDEQPA